MPVLAGVAQADRLAVLDDVGEDADLRAIAIRVAPAHRALNVAETAGEVAQLLRRQALIGKAQHAVLAERAQQRREVTRFQGLRKVHAPDRRAEYLTACNDFRQDASASIEQHERRRS